MNESIRKKISRGTWIMLGTTLLAAGQSIYEELSTSDYAHVIVSRYFVVESIMLLLIVSMGLRNKWTRILLIAPVLYEAWLFFLDSPVSPHELLMVVIFGLRVYVISLLFGNTMNRYYKAAN
jgi:hypothetical protein